MKNYSDFNIDLGGRSGVEVAATCPQCSAQRKKPNVRCLSVNTEKNCWVCHHCGWAGSLKQGEWERPRFTVKPHYRAPTTLPQALLDFFEPRGIKAEILQKTGIGLETVYLPQFEAETQCITFPYFRSGEIANIKYRGLHEKAFRQVAHAEKILHNLDSLKDQTIAVFCEGELDVLSVMQAGIPYAVSVPDGAPPENAKSSERKFEYLTNCAPELAGLTKIILAVDSDGPGQTLEGELARRLGPERCWRVAWPEGCKDANDVLTTFGPDTLRQCIENAEPYPLEGVVTVSDMSRDVLSLYENGASGGVSTGWYRVNEFYTVKPGELTIVTGIPSHGKSQLLDALAVNLAREHGWTFGVCSPENLPVHRHISKLVELYTGFPFREGPSMRLHKDELLLAIEWLEKHFVFLGTGDMVTIPSLLDTAKNLVARYGIKGLILDPWNEFDHTRPSGQSETEYIGAILGKIRRFARANEVHIWVVSHPQKLYRREDGSYPVPTPYDISGSAHWRNKADNCLTLWRDVEDPISPVKLYVQKIRFREVGKVGMVQLYFDKLNGRYSDRPSIHKTHWTEPKERVIVDVN